MDLFNRCSDYILSFDLIFQTFIFQINNFTAPPGITLDLLKAYFNHAGLQMSAKCKGPTS